MTKARAAGEPEADIRDVTPVDSIEAVPEGGDSTPLSRGRSALFLLGTAVAACGLWIMRSVGLVGFRLPVLLEHGYQVVHTYREVVVGGGVVVIGALVAAFAVSGPLPDRLDGRSLAFVRGWSLRRSGPALIVGLTCYAAVLGFVCRDEKSPWVFLLFLVSLGLMGFAVHRSDIGPGGRRLGFGRIDAAIMAGLFVLVVSVNLVDLTDWRFSFIGDEGAFFSLARDLAFGVDHSLFDLAGVYNTHPVLDSAYLACFLRLFGADIIGWRLAEIFALTASALLVYALVLALFGRVPAVVGAVILGTNHYLMAFARIGYNNLHCVFYALLVVLLLVLAWRSERALFTFLTGAAMGLCIYTFAAALLIWPVVAVLVSLKFLRRPSVRGLAAIGLLIAGFALVVTPGLLTTPPDHLMDLAVEQGHREWAAQDPIGVARISLVRSFLVFWVNPQWFHHFVGGPLLDPVTGVLCVIGFAIGVVRTYNGAGRIGLVWFTVGLLLIAAANYDIYPFFTRLLILIPACAILAAIGVAGLATVLRGLRLPAAPATGAILVLTALIPILNLQQLLVTSPKVLEINHETITVKALQENPGRVIIEVGGVRNANLIKVVNRYSRLRDFYRFSTVEELQLPVTPIGPEHRLPIYLVRDRAMVATLEEKLPPGYFSRTDVGVKGYPQIWLLVPPS